MAKNEEKIGDITIKDYLSCLRRAEGLVLKDKNSVSEYFKLAKFNKRNYEAFSRLLTFIDKKLEGYEELVLKLRKTKPHKPRS